MPKLSVDKIGAKLGRRVDLKTLASADLSGHKINDLGSFHNCVALTELDLSNNYLTQVRQLKGLFDAPQLRKLVLSGNRLAKKSSYRAEIIANIPTLTHLDAVPVTSEEREAAFATFPNLRPKGKLPTLPSARDVAGPSSAAAAPPPLAAPVSVVVSADDKDRVAALLAGDAKDASFSLATPPAVGGDDEYESESESADPAADAGADGGESGDGGVNDSGDDGGGGADSGHETDAPAAAPAAAVPKSAADALLSDDELAEVVVAEKAPDNTAAVGGKAGRRRKKRRRADPTQTRAADQSAFDSIIASPKAPTKAAAAAAAEPVVPVVAGGAQVLSSPEPSPPPSPTTLTPLSPAASPTLPEGLESESDASSPRGPPPAQAEVYASLFGDDGSEASVEADDDAAGPSLFAPSDGGASVAEPDLMAPPEPKAEVEKPVFTNIEPDAALLAGLRLLPAAFSGAAPAGSPTCVHLDIELAPARMILTVGVTPGGLRMARGRRGTPQLIIKGTRAAWLDFLLGRTWPSTSVASGALRADDPDAATAFLSLFDMAGAAAASARAAASTPAAADNTAAADDDSYYSDYEYSDDDDEADLASCFLAFVGKWDPGAGVVGHVLFRIDDDPIPDVDVCIGADQVAIVKATLAPSDYLTAIRLTRAQAIAFLRGDARPAMLLSSSLVTISSPNGFKAFCRAFRANWMA